jgi:hypothetical protein
MYNAETKPTTTTIHATANTTSSTPEPEPDGNNIHKRGNGTTEQWTIIFKK